jgi:hypothetical protein
MSKIYNKYYYFSSSFSLSPTLPLSLLRCVRVYARGGGERGKKGKKPFLHGSFPVLDFRRASGNSPRCQQSLFRVADRGRDFAKGRGDKRLRLDRRRNSDRGRPPRRSWAATLAHKRAPLGHGRRGAARAQVGTGRGRRGRRSPGRALGRTRCHVTDARNDMEVTR